MLKLPKGSVYSSMFEFTSKKQKRLNLLSNQQYNFCKLRSFYISSFNDMYQFETQLYLFKTNFILMKNQLLSNKNIPFPHTVLHFILIPSLNALPNYSQTTTTSNFQLIPRNYRLSSLMSENINIQLYSERYSKEIYF